jgi:type IV secretion system protein VirB2
MTTHKQLTSIISSALVLTVMLPTVAFASAGSGGGLPYEGWLNSLRNSITGPVAFTVAIVALVGTGASLIFQAGDMNTFLRSFVFFILVAAFVIAANNIMSGFFGHGALAYVDALHTAWA